nr:G protein pathway suppressor 2 isoform X2 [Pan paniscus]
MPALLERPKLSNAMARALHRHIMMERERKRQEEEEVDKMMEQKMKEEQERRKKKEMEERMSLEETKEQILKLEEKLLALQEEKHQLFLQLKKVLHEEEKRRRKEQSDLTTLTSAAYQQSLTVHTGTHLLSMQGSPGGHNRPGTLMAADRAKQMFGPQVLTVSSSLVVPCPCKSRWNMLTSRLASPTHPLCAPCTPRLCIQPLDSLLPPSSLCRCSQQESRALQLPANLALGSPSSNTARTRDSTTSDHQIISSTPHPPPHRG